MGVKTLPRSEEDVLYPESDGKPMADNTKQFRYIVVIKEGLEILFRDDPNVFVAGDLLWYAIQGQPAICTAPDVLVAFGRPKGDRGSYRQWREDNLAPQVVFEVLSPGNKDSEMADKFAFYQHYGVEEYYLYDPDRGRLAGWQRIGGALRPIAQMQGWVSPRLGVRFELSGLELHLFMPDGRRFETPVELDARAAREGQRAEQERRRAEQARQRAAQAEVQREQERRRAEQAEAQREQEHQRAERLAARLRALGVDDDLS